MGRPKKCVVCNEVIIDNEQSVPYKGRFAHKKCFDIAIKALHGDKIKKIQETTSKKKGQKIKPLAELKNSLSEEEYVEKKRYYDYLRSLIGEQELSTKIYVLTDEYVKRYSFSYKEMHQTLIYLKEIIEKDLVGDVVGIIPYYYDEAKRYYDSINKISEANDNADFSSLYHEKTVVIRPAKRKIKQIDIGSIGESEEEN